jgi:hypothetical protein
MTILLPAGIPRPRVRPHRRPPAARRRRPGDSRRDLSRRSGHLAASGNRGLPVTAHTRRSHRHDRGRRRRRRRSLRPQRHRRRRDHRSSGRPRGRGPEYGARDLGSAVVLPLTPRLTLRPTTLPEFCGFSGSMSRRQSSSGPASPSATFVSGARNVHSSADEYIAVITCARRRPETRSGREAGVVHEGVPCSPPSASSRPTTSPQAQPAWTRITQ